MTSACHDSLQPQPEHHAHTLVNKKLKKLEDSEQEARFEYAAHLWFNFYIQFMHLGTHSALICYNKVNIRTSQGMEVPPVHLYWRRHCNTAQLDQYNKLQTWATNHDTINQNAYVATKPWIDVKTNIIELYVREGMHAVAFHVPYSVISSARSQVKM